MRQVKRRQNAGPAQPAAAMGRLPFPALGLSFVTVGLTSAGYAKDTEGCYRQDYSEAWLKQNPDQHVAALRLKFSRADDGGGLRVDVSGHFHGRGRRAGLVPEDYAARGECQAGAGELTCRSRCDASGFTVASHDDDSIMVSMPHFTFASPPGCAGFSNFTEPKSQPTIFHLERAEASACSGEE